jgi:uncharacterized protein YjbI with pentapeptide repeats
LVPIARQDDVSSIDFLREPNGYELPVFPVAGTSSDRVLEVRDLTVSYGKVEALSNANLDRANLSYTNLLGAKLKAHGNTNMTGAMMPDGTIYE